MQKTGRPVYSVLRQLSRSRVAVLENRSRVRTNCVKASTGKRLVSTCPYQTVAASIANRKDDAIFSMAIRTAQVEIVQQMLTSGTKVTAVVEPGAKTLSFAACKAQEAQEALDCAQEQYAMHANYESKQSLDDAMEHRSAQLEVLSLLLAHGADPDEIYMPGDGKHTHQYKYKPRRLLHQAAIWNNVAMTALLKANNADNNARDFSGWTSMHHAAALNHHAVMIELLSQKAAVSPRDNSNVTPLHLAAKADALEVTELLLGHKAQKHATDQAGDTPLHAAAQHAGPPLLKMLLDKGCNPLAENLLGKVPSDLANRPGNEAVTSLIVEACVDRQMALRAPARHSS
ncbi:hypothetical protein WJX77_008877 [Trebouxia sp. C0004]